ncbi:TetR family transcriptional regulator (plasmid) [Streptomyces scopuliridis]|uniref:TetR family transcriptional regulator n=1 Tax=Streptomyces scopuliridis TaxID=452529 RepID=A0ACD4ZYZ4_9ACTN|nr:TetR family transcriptional regulator [Streptomyces scopuliridis]WSB39306.1 TetR family transcriptional regulator [Streptomyces scopuliridis]WSC03556.1 TetR family transcriptional regulator [Streptomyces scopuliridis]WSC11300.1 TetR family transcriptional regulator [Streptomyces scopuliridis]
MTTAHQPPPHQPASLRERKKLRTRQTLADTAVALFAERGFDSTPLDVLLERVEVSRRTFFRNYRSKEDVALTAFKELWSTFLGALDEREQSGRLVDVFRDTMLATLDRMGSTWHPRFAATLRLIEESPSLNGYSLRHCDEIQSEIKQRLGTPDTLELRLALEFCVAAWRCAYDQWLPDCDPAQLPRCVRGAFNAMNDGLSAEI